MITGKGCEELSKRVFCVTKYRGFKKIFALQKEIS
jgi:hypothetical protein